MRRPVEARRIDYLVECSAGSSLQNRSYRSGDIAAIVVQRGSVDPAATGRELEKHSWEAARERALAEAALHWLEGRYIDYVQRLEPFRNYLSPLQRRKLDKAVQLCATGIAPANASGG